MKLRVAIVAAFVASAVATVYEPNWESLDSRPIPDWYDKAKIGCFVHWGIYSVISFYSEWFWWQWKIEKRPDRVKHMEDNYKPNFTYQTFAPSFTCELFKPDFWAELFKNAGCKYVVLTSKHHEGYTLWPSKYSYSWNAMDIGPARDLLGDFARSCREKGLKFGAYHSLLEWFHPLYLYDMENNFTTQKFVKTKVLPEMYELVEEYLPDYFWSDGEYQAPDTYWKSPEFVAWLYNESPVKDHVVTNDRWGNNVICKHGGVITCNDRFNPGVLQPRKWENCFSLDTTAWGFSRPTTLSEFMTIKDVIKVIVETVSCGGNVLVNVGPTPYGTIPLHSEYILLEMGTWLKINGEGIYGSIPWVYQNDTVTPGVWYTQSGDYTIVYVFVLTWPPNNVLKICTLHPEDDSEIHMLGVPEALEWEKKDDCLEIKFPCLTPDKDPSKYAWVLSVKNPKCDH